MSTQEGAISRRNRLKFEALLYNDLALSIRKSGRETGCTASPVVSTMRAGSPGACCPRDGRPGAGWDWSRVKLVLRRILTVVDCQIGTIQLITNVAIYI